MIRIDDIPIGGMLRAMILTIAALLALVVVGSVFSLRPHSHPASEPGAGAVDPAAGRVSIRLPPYHQRADPVVRAAVAPIGGETMFATTSQTQITGI